MTKELRRDDAFLSVWSSVENKCFNGKLTKDKIQNFTLNCNDCQSEFDQIFEHFHKRYQNREKLELFLNNEDNNWFESLLAQDVSKASTVEKTKFMVYVAERYKSYIFDQNQSESVRLEYKTEIDYCVNAMKQIFSRQLADEEKILKASQEVKDSTVHLMSYMSLENK